MADAYYRQHQLQMQNYKNSAIPRPSEKMDSYFPPYSTIVPEIKRNSIEVPSHKKIPASRFKQTSSRIRPQKENHKLVYLSNPTIHNESEAGIYHISTGHQNSSNSSSPLQRFSLKYEQSEQPPTLHLTNPSISQFSDDETSSEEEEEEYEEEDEVEHASTSSHQSNGSVKPAPFTPPKPDEHVINEVANLMRSSSYRQRKAAVHFESRYKSNLRSADKDENDRRGRQMTSHWVHQQENDESSLPTDHSHSSKRSSVEMRREQSRHFDLDDESYENDLYKIFKDLNGTRNSKRFQRQPIPSQFDSSKDSSSHARRYRSEPISDSDPVHHYRSVKHLLYYSP